MNSAVAVDVPISRSSAVARLADDGATVEVRCGDRSCRKLLYKVGRASDGSILVARLCPGLYQNVVCGLMNAGPVTGRPGIPVASGLPADWRCGRCDRHLAHIHPVKGRLTVRCRCGIKTAVIAADAMQAMQALARAS